MNTLAEAGSLLLVEAGRGRGAGAGRRCRRPLPALVTPETSWRSRKPREVATNRVSLAAAKATATPRPLRQTGVHEVSCGPRPCQAQSSVQAAGLLRSQRALSPSIAIYRH